jgi:Transposase, Mutator family
VRPRGAGVRSKALVVAYAVHETGRREVIGIDIGEVESEAFWVERSAGALSGTVRLLNVNSKPMEASVQMPGADLLSGPKSSRFTGT